jgi:CheY-like chemotaxis protein
LERERCKILLVEDRREIADEVIEQLRGWGHDAVAVCSALAAVSKARSYDPDVVLIDLDVPSNDYAVQKIKELCPSARLVALGEFSQADIVRRSAESGFDGVLVKPTSPPDLKDAVDTQCEERNDVNVVALSEHASRTAPKG